MSEAMMDSITVLMIGRRLIGLELQGSVFAPFCAGKRFLLISKQMLDDLEEMREERGEGRGERGEQFFRTCELMPSGRIAESESRFDSILSTLSGEKDTESRDSWVRLGKVGRESDGFRTQDLAANTEFRHSVFSRAVSTMRPFEVREGMEGEGA